MPNMEENKEHILPEEENAPAPAQTPAEAPLEEKAQAPVEEKTEALAEEKAEASAEEKAEEKVAEKSEEKDAASKQVPPITPASPYYTRYAVSEANEKDEEAERREKKRVRTRNAVLAVLLAFVLLSSALYGGFTLGRLNLPPASGGTTTTGNGGDGGSRPGANRGDLVLNVVERAEGTPAPGSIPGVVAAVGASVVDIDVLFTAIDPYAGSTQYGGSGSGVLISSGNAEGLILTCNHIIDGADEGSITVTLADGRTYTGSQVEVLGGDRVDDIALLQIKERNGSVPANLTYATLATSGKAGDYSYMALGEDVVVIGNTLGVLSGTVTSGIISGHSREVIVDDTILTLTQIDAALNPGSSGGGAFNMAGELIGIVSAKTTVSNAEGVGYITPSSDIIPIIGELYTQGYVSGRPYLGLYFGISSGYFVVTSYEYNNELPFGKSLQAGDYITYVDGEIPDSSATFRRILSTKSVGDYVTVTIARLTGDQFVTFDVSLRVHEYRP